MVLHADDRLAGHETGPRTRPPRVADVVHYRGVSDNGTACVAAIVTYSQSDDPTVSNNDPGARLVNLTVFASDVMHGTEFERYVPYTRAGQGAYPRTWHYPEEHDA